MKSRSASVVGAITRAARASRKRRSTPSSRRNAAPPHTFNARSVTSIDASAWQQELQSHGELFTQLAARLPRQLTRAKAQFERKLAA